MGEIYGSWSSAVALRSLRGMLMEWGVSGGGRSWNSAAGEDGKGAAEFTQRQLSFFGD